MKEISPELNVSREDFSGENWQTYWKSIFDFKRLKVSKQKVFVGRSNRWNNLVYALSAVEERSSSSSLGCARDEG